MSDKTATERLRQLLDERGVEWWAMHDVENGYRDDRDTEFLVYGCKHVAHEWGSRLQVDMLTSEQAIEATLGRGTCHVAYKHPEYPCSNDEICSECGASFYCYAEVNFCPTCGRRVES